MTAFGASSSLRAHRGEGRFTQPTPATQASPRELVFMPLFGRWVLYSAPPGSCCGVLSAGEKMGKIQAQKLWYNAA
jgi:hypothetical protein